ncbi:MAG: NDP-sugar synthase, partial [Acidobacteria bacterium]|nr:NDP-sugar synthase [Acidobacteriota bacterium]
GGKGTRLRPLTVYTPKPIVPIVNRPLIQYQIDILKKAGITDITLSLSYQPDKIEQLIGSAADHGVLLRYVTEPSPMGTAGAYKYAVGSSQETTIVFNGDVITDLDVNKLVEFHRSSNAVATLALAPVSDPSRYGLVPVDKAGKITDFLEKPTDADRDKIKANTINAGVYVLEPQVLAMIPKDTNRSFEYDVFPEMLSTKLPFVGYVMKDAYWRDIGTPESYLAAHHDFLSGKIRGAEMPEQDLSDIATHAEIDRTSVIGNDCSIKPGVRIANSVIGNGVHVEEKAVVENSVIWSHTRVASAAEIRDSVIGRSCHIGRNAIVGPGSVLGDKSSLTDYTKV